MNKRLDDLRAQRASIQKHLDWLDEQIRLEADDDAPPSDAPPPPANVTPFPQPEASPPKPKIPEAAAPTGPDYVPDPENMTAPNRRGDVQRAKFGCVMIFGLATALFLFLLFGLPYLLD